MPPLPAYRKHHISMYFLRNIIFHFPSVKKISCFREERNAIFPYDISKIIFQCNFFGKASFRNISRIYHISMYFFWERSSFICRLKNNITFFGEKNYHVSWWYKEDHIPVQFFWKDYLFRTFGEKNMAFCAVQTAKASSAQCSAWSLVIKMWYYSAW